jgi:hypothetical protein
MIKSRRMGRSCSMNREKRNAYREARREDTTKKTKA